MKTIIGIRKSLGKQAKDNRFRILLTDNATKETIRKRILKELKKEPYGNYEDTDEPIYDFYVIDETGKKKLYNSLNILNQDIAIIDDTTIINIKKEGNYRYFINFVSGLNESLPQESSVKQLKDLRRKTKSVTIDDKVPDAKMKLPNRYYLRNPIDTGVESFQDYLKSNKKKNKKIKTYKEHKNFK